MLQAIAAIHRLRTHHNLDVQTAYSRKHGSGCAVTISASGRCMDVFFSSDNTVLNAHHYDDITEMMDVVNSRRDQGVEQYIHGGLTS
jgi:hypothetical protein